MDSLGDRATSSDSPPAMTNSTAIKRERGRPGKFYLFFGFITKRHILFAFPKPLQLLSGSGASLFANEHCVNVNCI